MRLVAFLKTYKWALILIVTSIALFYWYEIRPIHVYRQCSIEASKDARSLLANKAEISKGTDQGESYQKLIEKNLYLRSDYDSFLKKCLLFHGMEITSVSTNAGGGAAEESSSSSL